MAREIEVTPVAWAAFEDLFVRNQNGGVDRVVKAARLHIEQHGWQDWFPIIDKRQFRDRIIAIYRNWSSIRYAAQRRQQLLDAKFAYWVYHNGNSLQPRPSHVALDGIALPSDHPFWQSHVPPCGWNCSCYIVGAGSPAGARRVRGDPDKTLPNGWDRPLPETGLPLGIDPMFGGLVKPDLLQIMQGVLNGLADRD
jgi:hypothetical protein